MELIFPTENLAGFAQFLENTDGPRESGCRVRTLQIISIVLVRDTARTTISCIGMVQVLICDSVLPQCGAQWIKTREVE